VVLETGESDWQGGPQFRVSQERAVVPVAVLRVDDDYKQTWQWVVPKELMTDPNWKPPAKQ
jgi:hypothetical protein